MSQIVTLYSDKERTDALYPRTKVSAISDDNNTSLQELMTGTVKQEEGGTEEEVVTPINADTLGGKLTANNVVFYEEEMVDEFGQVVVRNADKLNNKDGDYYDYRNSTLTLEEIQASTDLSGKIASASALKGLITIGEFRANLSVGVNSVKLLNNPTDRVISGTLPSSSLCIININSVAKNNNFYWDYHFDEYGASLRIYTDYAQEIVFK